MSTESIWTRPAPGRRQPSLSREQIAQAAIHLIDSEGIKSLSMRRLSQAMDVGTMTLYYYVHTKDELLALVEDAIMAEIVIAEDEFPQDDWRLALTMIANRSRELFKRHPWRLSVIGGVANPVASGPNALRHYEQSLAAAAMTGLGIEDCLDIAITVDNHVLADALRASESHRHEDDDAVEVVATMRERLATGEYPFLSELFVRSAASGKRSDPFENDVARFTRGLDRILDSVALDVKRQN